MLLNVLFQSLFVSELLENMSTCHHRLSTKTHEDTFMLNPSWHVPDVSLQGITM